MDLIPQTSSCTPFKAPNPTVSHFVRSGFSPILSCPQLKETLQY